MRWAVVLGVALAARAAGADAGRIEGFVSNAAGGSIPRATVSAQSRGGRPSTAVTDGEGRYRLDVAAGVYDVTVVAGAARVVRADVAVVAGETTRVDARLDTRPAEVITIRQKAPRSQRRDVKPTERYERLRLPYSSKAILQDAWGIGWYELTIDERGRVTGVQVLKPAGYDLDVLAEKKLRAWRFEPARDDAGGPVKSRYVYILEWPSYWATLMGKPGLPPCKGSGPWKMGSLLYKGYIDCSVPKGVTPGPQPVP